MYDKPTANIILNGETLKAFPLRSGTRHWSWTVSTLATIIQHSFGSSSQGSQRRKINKRNPDWERRSKTLFVDDTIWLDIEKPKDNVRKVMGYKINTQKWLAFL